MVHDSGEVEPARSAALTARPGAGHALGRVGVAALGTAGLVGLYLEFYTTLGWRGFVDYAGYFTNLSNLLFILTNLGLAFLPLSRTCSGAFLVLRGTATVGMVVTGIGYAALLSETAGFFQHPWINYVIHGIMPVLALLDWLVFPPGPPRLRLRDAARWLAFGLFWLVYTMVRGGILSWYPYPFIDPAAVGWPAVVAAISALAVVMALVALALLRYQNRRCRRL